MPSFTTLTAFPEAQIPAGAAESEPRDRQSKIKTEQDIKGSKSTSATHKFGHGLVTIKEDFSK